MDAISSWVVTDGKAGMESQCLGLAETLGLTPVVKRVRLRTPWRQLTPHFRLGGGMQFSSFGAALAPPWPDLLIATGRHSVAASLFVRRRSRRQGRGSITVQLQNPVISPRYFDLVVTPRHDELTGTNVVATRGALHRITKAVLAEGAAKLAPRVAQLPRPYIAFLAGGTNAAYQLTPAQMKTIAVGLAEAARDLRGSLLVTPSRRTGVQCVAALREALADIPHFLWDESGENPYFGILGLADFAVVTADSVNMVSEALATAKPVYVADLPGGSRKFRRFHRLMREEGLTRRFEGALERYAYAPPDDMGDAAARVRALLAARGHKLPA